MADFIQNLKTIVDKGDGKGKIFKQGVYYKEIY